MYDPLSWHGVAVTLVVVYVLLCVHVVLTSTRSGDRYGTDSLLQSPVFVPGGRPTLGSSPFYDHATTLALVLSRAYCWFSISIVLLYSRSRSHMLQITALSLLALCHALLMLRLDPTDTVASPVRYLAVACVISAYGVSVLGMRTLGTHHASVVNCAVVTICSCLGVDAAVNVARL
jgi:hypothetical protein